MNRENKNKFETYYSTIDLNDSYFSTPKKYSSEKKKYTIVHTANSINNDSKGHDVVLDIVKKLNNQSVNTEVIFIGDGVKKDFYEQRAIDYNIGDKVRFVGSLPTSKDVRKVLLEGDLFVFPTKAEGLPRAIIEAMAVGLPCLSTPVNGIPELLNDKYLFNQKDVNGFVKKINDLIKNPKELEEMSKNNIEKAKEYKISELSLRRKKFYLQLKNIK